MQTFSVAGLDRPVSALAMGCGMIGGLVARGDAAEQRSVFRAALGAGVTMFDTAPMYGGGTSEEVVGRVLAELGEEPVVATKFHLRGDQLDDPVAAIEASVATSLARLRRERIDLLYVHDRIGRTLDPVRGVLTPDLVLRPGGIADVMEDLVARGRVAALGFCGFGHGDAALEVLESRRFAVTQVPVNLVNDSAVRDVGAAWRQQDHRAVARRAHELGVAVVAIRALAAGALTGAADPHPYAADVPLRVAVEADADRARAAAHAHLADEPGGLARSAIRFVLGQPCVDSVVLGISDAHQLDEALAAVAAGPLPAAALDRVHADDADLFLTV